MPKFPLRDVPARLNPLNLQDYLRLADWVYFRPAMFSSYLYSAEAEVYRQTGWRKFRASWRVAAYRSLYLMLPLALMLLVVFSGLTGMFYVMGTLQGNTAWVNAIACQPKICVTAAGDRALKFRVPAADSSLKIWDMAWGRELHTLKGHGSGVTTVAITADGRIVSGSRDRTLRVWDLKSGNLQQTLTGHQDWITSLIVTPDGRAISASGDRTLKLWDLQQNQPVHTFEGHQDLIWEIALTPQGQVVSASSDRTLKVWDLATRSLLHTLTGHQSWVTGVAVSTDGKTAISASMDKTLKVWDLATGKELHTLTGHTGWVTGVAIKNDGTAVSASTDKTLKVWDLATGKELHTLTGHTGWVTRVLLSRDGRSAISASTDQSLKIWDLASATLRHTLAGHQAWVTAMTMMPDDRLISASFDRYPKLWNLKGKELAMVGVKGTVIGVNLGFLLSLILATIATIVSIAIALAIAVMLFGVAGSAIGALLVGTVSSLIFCLAYLVIGRIASDPLIKSSYNAENISTDLVVIFGIAFGIAIATAFALSSRTALGVLGSVIAIAILGIAVGIVVASVVTASISFQGRFLPGIRAGIAVAIAFNALVAIGASRFPFYPFQFLLALYSRLKGKWHPLHWDDLLVLPVPFTQSLLVSQLQRNESDGLQRLAEVAENPFQRGSCHRALSRYFHTTTAPLHFLYTLLSEEKLDTYAIVPVSPQDWQLLPTRRQLLLGGLAHQRVDCSSDWLSQMAESLVGGLYRYPRHTPLTRFAAMLYELMYVSPDIDLAAHYRTYNSLNTYSDGTEISNSFEVLATFLAYDKLSALAIAPDIISLNSEDWIRPTVQTAISDLGKVGTEVAQYQVATSKLEQLSALLRGKNRLDTLAKDSLEMVFPEQVILQLIIKRWRQLIEQEIGNLAI